MTAEVAIMNSVGVALAADSAVTIGTDARKIFTSTDKLFQLSKFQPIAVMINGNANFLGLPWETIIKEYRLYVGQKSLPAVEDYVASFFRFVARHAAMFPRSVQDSYTVVILQGHLVNFRDKILKRRLDEAALLKPITDTDVTFIVAQCVGLLKETFAKFARLPGFNAGLRTRISRQYRAVVSRLVKELFGKIPIAPKSRRELIETMLGMLSRRVFGSLQTGLVFAGFGRDEYFPTLVALEVECSAAGKIRMVQAQKTAIDPLGPLASVNPFAQQEVVQTFMEGVDAKLKDDYRKITLIAFSQVGEAVVKAIEPKSKQIAQEVQAVFASGLPRVVRELAKGWESMSSQHWGPITEIVATLPKDELGAMAEALVNLTKFKRRITPQRETVGGPIDVAIITKGDGFVWIKRKHYFDPELNPRAMNRLSTGENK